MPLRHLQGVILSINGKNEVNLIEMLRHYMYFILYFLNLLLQNFYLAIWTL